MEGNKKQGDIMNKNPIEDLKKYREFLETIPLVKYREELKDIKWVEQDLHPLLYPQESIFEKYWEKHNYLDFEDWFNEFWGNLNKEENTLEKLRDFKEVVRAHRKFYNGKINGDHENRFFLGFKARMYRTWISVLTQLDFCYLINSLFEKEGKGLQVECNAELDVKEGVDARVNNIGFQIAKISQRKEALKISRKKSLVTIPYAVFDIKEYERLVNSPRVKDKTGYQRALQAFHKYFIRLQNGFVVFNENYLKPIIKNIEDIEKVKEVVKQISLELSGEK